MLNDKNHAPLAHTTSCSSSDRPPPVPGAQSYAPPQSPTLGKNNSSSLVQWGRASDLSYGAMEEAEAHVVATLCDEDPNNNSNEMIEAEVVNTFPLFTPEDYNNPLRFLGKCILYAIFFPVIFSVFILPKMLKVSWRVTRTACRKLWNTIGLISKFISENILTPIWNGVGYILTPIYDCICWFYRTILWAIERAVDGVRWVCNKIWGGFCLIGRFVRDYFIYPVRNAIVWLLTSFRDYILIPLKNAFVYIADMFYKCCSFVYRTFRDFVLVPIKNAVVWIAKSFRDYVLIPLKNTAVYIATRIYEGFCFTGRSIRDYILIPLKNTAVYIATRIYEWFCFTGRSTRDYLLIPIRNFLLFLGTSIRDGVLVPARNLAVWIGTSIRKFVFTPSYNAVVWVVTSIQNFIIVPAWNGFVLITTTVKNGIVFFYKSTRNNIVVPVAKATNKFVVMPIYNFVSAVGHACLDAFHAIEHSGRAMWKTMGNIASRIVKVFG